MLNKAIVQAIELVYFKFSILTIAQYSKRLKESNWDDTISSFNSTLRKTRFIKLKIPPIESITIKKTDKRVVGARSKSMSTGTSVPKEMLDRHKLTQKLQALL